MDRKNGKNYCTKCGWHCSEYYDLSSSRCGGFFDDSPKYCKTLNADIGDVIEYLPDRNNPEIK